MNRKAGKKNGKYPLYDLPRISNLRELVELKYRSCPGNTAFSYLDKEGNKVSKTFKDVYHDMNALENRMRAQGIQNRHIALIGENSYPWLIAFLAVVNGGNVAVPIDRGLPGEEIVGLLKKADVTMVFCSDSCKGIFSGNGFFLVQGTETFLGGEDLYGCKTAHELEQIFEPEIVTFAELEEIWSGADSGGNGRITAVDADKCCCIFFTSGTSGTAKGVCLSQRNLASEIVQAGRMVGLAGNTVSLLPFHHAFGLVEGILAAFHYGYEIYLNQSIKTVKQSLVEQKPQNLFLVPLYVETFHRQVWAAAKKQGREKTLRRLMKVSNILLKAGIDLRIKLFSSVRESFGGKLEYIICGGASLDPAFVREFRSWGIEILNGYGTTECSPCVAVNRNFCHKDGTVGLPLPDVEVEVAPDGEIRVWGDIVMLGYYKDPEATALTMQDGWYATGDLGHLDGDGFLTLTGRKKNLIILSNGENVSPEELEAAFIRDEGVREVLVYERERMIVAEIYPEEERTGDEAYFGKLLQKVNQGLPAHKRIAKVVLRGEEFAKNSSMKIIRHSM